MDYVDIVFAHRPDPNVPMLEVVRGFNWLIEQGKALYWGTSEWSSEQIEEAHVVAEKYLLHAPIADQCQYSALKRQRIDKDLVPVFEKYNYGTTIWSPLAGSLLTGIYNDGVIPADSRLATNADVYFKGDPDKLQSPRMQAALAKVKQLTAIADELGVTTAQLALAWAAKNPHVSTMIIGASKPEQIIENIGALELVPKITDELWSRIDTIFALE
ncbi:Aldo/keto reductase [Clavulina sp. PMI_390]|nr:Aldo/keto reductase [Clavulina sp. PMI_390]